MTSQGARLSAARVAAGFGEPESFCAAKSIALDTYNLHESNTVPLDVAAALSYAQALGNCLAGWLLTGEGLAILGQVPATAKDKGREPWERFSAARQAYWNDLHEAARELSITAANLVALERGDLTIHRDLLLRFCGLTRCPREWIEMGSIERMEAIMVVRIAQRFSALLPLLVEDISSRDKEKVVDTSMFRIAGGDEGVMFVDL